LSRHHKDDVDWADAVGKPWDKRADIVHEGFGAVHEAVLPEVSAEEINAARYLFILTLLYVLEQRAKGLALEVLWDPRNLDPYMPGVALTFGRMPWLHQFVNQQRRRYFP
jgi:hypothetical protein